MIICCACLPDNGQIIMIDYYIDPIVDWPVNDIINLINDCMIDLIAVARRLSGRY